MSDVRYQLDALYRTVIRVTNERDEPDSFYVNNMNAPFVARHEFLWSKREPETGQSPLFETSTIVLSAEFYAAIKAHPVPLEKTVVKAIRTTGGGALALDRFMWMKYRLSMAGIRGDKMPIRIPWSGLAEQFGGTFTRDRDFKAYFLTQFDYVQQAWPKFRFSDGGTYLQLARLPGCHQMSSTTKQASR